MTVNQLRGRAIMFFLFMALLVFSIYMVLVPGRDYGSRDMDSGFRRAKKNGWIGMVGGVPYVKSLTKKDEGHN